MKNVKMMKVVSNVFAKTDLFGIEKRINVLSTENVLLLTNVHIRVLLIMVFKYAAVR